MSSERRSVNVPGLSHAGPIPSGSRVGPLLASSGIFGKNPDGSVPDTPEGQVVQMFRNLERFLAEAGARPEEVVHVRIYLTDLGLRPKVNEEWSRLFPDADSLPARHVLLYELRGGMVAQLEALAHIG